MEPIPMTDADFAEYNLPIQFTDPKRSIQIRIDEKIYRFMRTRYPHGYQTAINGILKRYVEARLEAMTSES
jgi:uncharacterized protein (DUF4415 family)